MYAVYISHNTKEKLIYAYVPCNATVIAEVLPENYPASIFHDCSRQVII